METNKAAVTANDLTVTKARQTILSGLTFSIPNGKVVGLIGPSGSGKTTLMRSLIGAQVINEGSVSLLGERAGRPSLRKRIGYMAQSPSVYPDLTVGQNLAYFRTILGVKKENVSQTIETVELTGQKNQLVSTLSGGQRARVSLAVALLGDPEVLILDEPTVGLDPLLRDHLWKLFKSLAGGGKTLLISSHVMDEAERCDQILLMRGGKIINNSSLKDLLAKTNTDNLEEAFIRTIESAGKGDNS